MVSSALGNRSPTYTMQSPEAISALEQRFSTFSPLLPSYVLPAHPAILPTDLHSLMQWLPPFVQFFFTCSLLRMYWGPVGGSYGPLLRKSYTRPSIFHLNHMSYTISLNHLSLQPAFACNWDKALFFPYASLVIGEDTDQRDKQSTSQTGSYKLPDPLCTCPVFRRRKLVPWIPFGPLH